MIPSTVISVHLKILGDMKIANVHSRNRHR